MNKGILHHCSWIVVTSIVIAAFVVFYFVGGEILIFGGISPALPDESGLFWGRIFAAPLYVYGWPVVIVERLGLGSAGWAVIIAWIATPLFWGAVIYAFSYSELRRSQAPLAAPESHPSNSNDS